MLNIVLVEPEIPSNTGNIIRTCVATGSVLHLVRPLGFDTSDKMLKRAGLDYFYDAEILFWDSFSEVFEAHKDKQFFFFTTKGKKIYSNVKFPADCFLVFGKETKGLPEDLLLKHYGTALRIPMLNDTRSLNLSNTVAIAVFEALRQQGFSELNTAGHLTTEKNPL